MDINEPLQHYASPYYDPVKAHEYYMRTRELKGRRSTTKLNDEGKKVWAYTKNEISGKKKEKVKEEQEKRKQKIAELRAKAKVTREQISAKLKELNAQLTEESSSRRSSLMAIEIPSGLSKEERAKRVAERNEKIAKLRDDASEDKSKVSEQAKAEKEEVRTSASRKKKRITEDTKEERADNSANAKSEREKVSAELKAAVTAAREAYKAAKENLDATYEDLYQQEFDKIASEYKAVKKRKRRK